MADRRDLLIEIGTEEIPPKLLQPLVADLADGLSKRLAAAQLDHQSVRTCATPRRLALIVSDLVSRQPDQTQTRRGPAIQAAFDADGHPTRAAEGFARSCGISVDTLKRIETDKGSWLAHESVEAGQPTTSLVPRFVDEILSAVPLPKRMRWGDHDYEFIRPIHWLVLLFGNEVIPATSFGVDAGRESRGHRFHHPQPVVLESAASYESQLLSAKVMVAVSDRRRRIEQEVVSLATSVGGSALIDDELLDEVTALVEWPMALLGRFDQRFLEVPAEVLIITMQENQRYFPVVDGAGALLPYFITVANLESRDPEQVVSGNERVLRPRFSDAEFFWLQDRKRPLADRSADLKQVVFQEKLGSLFDRTDRLARLASFIADKIGANPAQAERVGHLSKCDLVTDMVQEFPELQGVMGGYYAEHDGEDSEISQALGEQYLPRFSGDRLPASPLGQALALADRFDALVGGFVIGQQPSGNRDPYGLRRAALGVLRILSEQSLDLDLREILAVTVSQFSASQGATEAVADEVFDFLIERLRGYLGEQDVPGDIFESVKALGVSRPVDFRHRVSAIGRFLDRPEAASLAAANKRIRNILRKADTTPGAPVSHELLDMEAETQLAAQLDQLNLEVRPMIAAGSYDQALEQLAVLRGPVDRFFDEVMVMAEDLQVRRNRLALLGALEQLFLGVGDFSKLQG